MISTCHFSCVPDNISACRRLMAAAATPPAGSSRSKSSRSSRKLWLSTSNFYYLNRVACLFVRRFSVVSKLPDVFAFNNAFFLLARSRATSSRSSSVAPLSKSAMPLPTSKAHCATAAGNPGISAPTSQRNGQGMALLTVIRGKLTAKRRQKR